MQSVNLRNAPPDVFDGREDVTRLNVKVDPVPSVDGLIRYVQGLTLPLILKQQLTDSRMEARVAYQAGKEDLGEVNPRRSRLQY